MNTTFYKSHRITVEPDGNFDVFFRGYATWLGRPVNGIVAIGFANKNEDPLAIAKRLVDDGFVTQSAYTDWRIANPEL